MATRICGVHRVWSGERDADGYVTYKIVHRVESDDAADGPQVVSTTLGLPTPGDFWLVGNDADIWAWCRWPMRITPAPDEEPPTRFWDVEQEFSTRPPEPGGGSGRSYCRDFQAQDPLLEPVKYSGSDNNAKVEATHDRFGKAIRTSSHEQLRGPQVEFDDGTSVVVIEQNVADLELDLCTACRNRVNAYWMWGMPPRTIKLSRFTWDAKYYGACFRYFTRRFEFEVNAHGFDRILRDEGYKALNGTFDTETGLWRLIDIAGAPPDPNNPTHFCVIQDRKGDPMRMPLDGHGQPFVPALNDLTYSCSECGQEGSPKYWKLKGFPEESEAVTLTNGGGCSWSGSSDAADYTLSFLPSVEGGQWSLTSSNYPGEFWTLEGPTWLCRGPNALGNLAAFFGDYEGPDIVAVYSGESPGVVPVQYYHQVDFLLLGVPALL